MKNVIVILLCFATLNIFAQAPGVPVPAKEQTKRYIISGATIHIGNGELIKNGYIEFDKGKIIEVGKASEMGPKNPSVDLIDATGKHIYPGIIAPGTTLGLNEINAVRATRDEREVGNLNPNVRSIVAYSTDSRVTPTVKSNGVLLAQITPVGGLISGTSSIVELDAWNWEDAAYKINDGLHLNWPKTNTRNKVKKNTNLKKMEVKRVERLIELDNLLNDAYAYAQKDNYDAKNLKLEAMRGLFDGKQQLFVHTSYAKSIIESVLFLKKHHIAKIIIVGGRDSWMITDFLKEHHISIILANVHSLPVNYADDIDLPYKTPYLLQKAGVQYCLGINGAWQQRNLMFLAGTGVTYGLTKEEALASITLNTAKILGIDKSVGSIEVGKDATFIVSEGDVLDMRTSIITQAFIRGKNLSLTNKQKALYQKYYDKYWGN